MCALVHVIRELQRNSNLSSFQPFPSSKYMLSGNSNELQRFPVFTAGSYFKFKVFFSRVLFFDNIFFNLYVERSLVYNLLVLGKCMDFLKLRR